MVKLYNGSKTKTSFSSSNDSEIVPINEIHHINDESTDADVYILKGEGLKHNIVIKIYNGVKAFLYIPALFLSIVTVFSILYLVRAPRFQITETNPENSKPISFAYDGVKKSVSWPDPPPHEELAAVARYVMHISDWGSLSTNSTHKGIEGYPFVNVFSVSDGPINNSTGVPYFYFTPLELSVKDMEVNNQVSFTVSEAQSNYCAQKGYDPEDPRCAHIIFTGSIKKVEKKSEEEAFAREALFSRHSEMKDWPAEHAWFFAKLDIIHIYVLDYFGGVGVVSPEEYFATNPF